MDFIFCLPIFFGCPTKIHPDGDPTPRVCPRCNNASVIQAQSRTWFELCFVPLVPMKKKHLWMCGICQWRIPMQPGWEPMIATQGNNHQGVGSMQQGYSPSYQQGPKA